MTTAKILPRASERDAQNAAQRHVLSLPSITASASFQLQSTR